MDKLLARISARGRFGNSVLNPISHKATVAPVAKRKRKLPQPIEITHSARFTPPAKTLEEIMQTAAKDTGQLVSVDNHQSSVGKQKQLTPEQNAKIAELVRLRAAAVEKDWEEFEGDETDRPVSPGVDYTANESQRMRFSANAHLAVLNPRGREEYQKLRAQVENIQKVLALPAAKRSRSRR